MSRHVRRLPHHFPGRTVLQATILLAVAGGAVATPRAVAAQKPSAEMIDRGHRMLAQIHKDLKELYFDPTFGGVDLDARYRAADSAISVAPNNNYIMAAVAQFVSELDDSHTRFYPPGHVGLVDYGYRTLFVGDTCYVSSVVAKSDAEAKGIKRGDALLKIDAFPIDRASYGTVRYVYDVLSPRTLVRLTVRSPGGEPRTVDVASKVEKGDRTYDLTDPEFWRRYFEQAEVADRVIHRWVELGDSVMVWRMSEFAGEDKTNINEMMKQVGKHRALVFDLRSNGGGSVATLEYLLSQFFDQDVTVGVQRRRSGDTPWVVKPSSKEPYRGMVVVLINSASASASELFSRVMQLEGRAIIVGDRSKGAVVGSRFYSHIVGAGLIGRSLDYGTQISVTDAVMSDGQRLEKVGVTPDHLVLPTAADIVARRDPALAKALSLVGVSISPESAAAMFRPRQTTER